MIKIQYPFTIKVLNNVVNKRTYCNIIKTVYDEPTANVLLNGAELNIFPLRSGIRQRCPFSPLLFNIIFNMEGMQWCNGLFSFFMQTLLGFL